MTNDNIIDLKKFRLKKDLDRLNHYCSCNEILVDRAIDILERLSNLITDDLILKEINDFLDDARMN